MTKEDLELLNARKLSGEKLFFALKHLETCESCRLKINLPTGEEVLKRIFDDENEIAALLNQSDASTNSPSRHKK